MANSTISLLASGVGACGAVVGSKTRRGSSLAGRRTTTRTTWTAHRHKHRPAAQALITPQQGGTPPRFAQLHYKKKENTDQVVAALHATTRANKKLIHFPEEGEQQQTRTLHLRLPDGRPFPSGFRCWWALANLARCGRVYD